MAALALARTADHWRAHGLAVTVEHADAERATLRLTGELDLASSAALSACVEHQVAVGRRLLRLDLDGITFVDASGLGAVLAAHHELRQAGGGLVIVALAPRVRRLVEVVGLEEVLLIAAEQRRSA